MEYVLKQARSKEAIIYYDINFRQAHKDEVIKLTPNLLENFDYATIVRGSSCLLYTSPSPRDRG